MYNKLAIHRFRGIKQGKLEDFDKINLLIGPNNSGKSAVLEMLYLSGVSGRPCTFKSDKLVDKEDKLILPEGSVILPADFLGYNPLSRLWMRHGFSCKWEENPCELTENETLSYFLKDTSGNLPFKAFNLIPPPTEDLKSYGGFNKEDQYTVASFKLSLDKELPSELFPDFLRPELSNGDKNIHVSYTWFPQFVYQGDQNTKDPFSTISAWAMFGEHPHSNHILLYDFHTTHDHFNSSFFEHAYKTIPDWHENIEESLSRVYPEMEGCRVDIQQADLKSNETGMTGYIRMKGQRPLPIDSFGDGMRHTMKVLVTLHALLYDHEPALFLWEDPELFMHPVALENLLREIVNLISRSRIQLFISTQSLELLVNVGNMIQENDLNKEIVRTYSLNLNEQGRLEHIQFNKEGINDWLQSGFDPRDGFSKKLDESAFDWRLKNEDAGKEGTPW